MPPCLSARSSTQRIDVSSSTTQTLSVFDGFMVVERQQDREHGVTGTAVELDQPVVPGHQVLRDGETETRAVGTPRDQRIKDRVLELGRNARAVVLDLD